MNGQYDPTPEQRKAIESYVKGSLSPLIESVLTKQLSMAAVFLHEQITGPTLAGGKLEAVHPNHRPDLAYILDTLCMVKPVLKNEPLRQQVEASINGMRYILQRTREAASGVTASAPNCQKCSSVRLKSTGAAPDGRICADCGYINYGVKGSAT